MSGGNRQDDGLVPFQKGIVHGDDLDAGSGHAGGNRHRKGRFLALQARSGAAGTGNLEGAAVAVALGAGLLDAEEALLHADLAVAAAGGA